MPLCALSNLPLRSADRAGERALAVAEQLGLQQVVGDRPAVDGDERPVGPRPVGVDHLRHQLLAGAALAVDEHRQVGRRGLLRDLQRFEQLGVVAERAFEHEAALEQALAPLPPATASARVGSAAAAFTKRSLCDSCITSSRSALACRSSFSMSGRSSLDAQRSVERRISIFSSSPAYEIVGAGVRILVEDLHAALNCFCTSW